MNYFKYLSYLPGLKALIDAVRAKKGEHTEPIVVSGVRIAGESWKVTLEREA